MASLFLLVLSISQSSTGRALVADNKGFCRIACLLRSYIEMSDSSHSQSGTPNLHVLGIQKVNFQQFFTDDFFE